MDRYSELKLLLKEWEGKFLQENKRKPRKDDVKNSTKEIQVLYQEFQSLKQNRRSISCVQNEASEEERVAEDSSSWGCHLNRDSVTPKLSPSECASLKASAQYYGMKLKSKLGSAVKDRPLSLKKPLTPSNDHSKRRSSASSGVLPPASSSSILPPASSSSVKPSASSSSILPPAASVFVSEDSSLSTEELSSSTLGLKTHKLTSKSSGQESIGKKFHQLQSKVGQRLSVLDPDWLERCEYRMTGRPAMRDVAIVEDQKETKPVCCVDISPSTHQHHSDVPVPTNTLSAQVGKHREAKPSCTAVSAQEGMQNDATPSSSAVFVQEGKQNDATPSSSAVSVQEGKQNDATPSSSAVSVQEGKQNDATPSSSAVSVQEGKQNDATPSSSAVRGRVLHRKRQRDTTYDVDTAELQSQSCKKRRKTRPTPEKKSRKQDPKIVKEDDCSLTENSSVKSDQGTENILGEVIEEELVQNISPHPQHSVRAPQRKNDNFVRINLKKKSHVKSFVLNGSRLRKQMWKQKWQKKGEHFGGGGKYSNRSGDTCFHCGQMGHWASQCPGKVPTVMKPQPDPVQEEEELVLPTLEDVARMTNTPIHTVMGVNDDHPNVYPDVVTSVTQELAPPPPGMKPLYELQSSGKIQETPPEVFAALSELGYQSFRPGQEEAIMRILSGLSSLAILSTGMGKSLCYQLPAYMYYKRSPCITLVISPLVSLMDDQVSGLPTKLKAVCVHSNMTRNQREAAIEKVKEGKVHVLLLSPEALVGGGQSGFSCLPPADQLPPVAFACIDEVHCVSEWSHNFRPCYLRLCKVLRERLGVRCLLGLTATATLSTAQDVARHLGISHGEETPLQLAGIPRNLHLSVSMDQDRDQALVALLKGDRFGCLDSVIIYCTRREETQRLAALLRTCLQGVLVKPSVSEEQEMDRKKIEARKKIRRPLKWMADSYHAGMSAAERRRVQNNFMSGQLRIVVATVAFGMGLDKSDVRGIIHYNMPKNFESYVQEIGRAGRDGKDAHCHQFLDPEGCEVDDDEMMEVLAQCEDHQQEQDTPERTCHMHERVLPIEDTVQALDMREEGIETLLCYLELHSSRWVELLHPTLSTCRLTCYSGPQQLRTLAHRCPPVAVALARERLSGIDHTHVSSLEFNVVELADSMGWEVIPVKRALRNVQWNSSSGGFRGTGRSGILVEFSKLSFHFRAYGDLTNEELESVCDFLHQKVSSRETTALRQLKMCYKAFQRVAFRSSAACAEQVNMERSALLKSHILDYFQGKTTSGESHESDSEEELRDTKVEDWRHQLCFDVRLFLSIHQDERFSGRAIARIFHGIGSPCYPAQIYGKDRRFWRKYLHLDFNKVLQICKEEIIRMR
ncbi:ATP-dependent DNA helicase Q4 isoform X2 [Hyperolius riggenbachi]|uniref:ATP-dependent DNA helicase Q4 isoform X2 n=1 Tax=Hyperolius riggenbachi TaxID=752182 RepID=UPI0035A34A7C